MAKRLSVAIVFLFFGGSAGCEANGNGGAGEGDVPAADVPGFDVPGADLDGVEDAADASDDPMRRYANAICGKLAQCAPALLQMIAGDVADCKVREYETVRPMEGLPGLGADWAACAGVIEAAPCGEILRMVLLEVLVPEACGLTSTLPDGSPCTHPFQCAGRICARAPGTPCGTCASPPAPGTDCVDENLLGSPCGVGNACAGGKCVALGETGDSCDPSTAPCFSDLGCVDGKCGPPRQADEPCSSLIGECDPYGAGLVCHPGLGTCTVLAQAGPGDACGLTESGGALCSMGTCYPSALAGHCTAQAADGESCDPENGPECRLHAHCVSGTCEQFFTPVCE